MAPNGDIPGEGEDPWQRSLNFLLYYSRSRDTNSRRSKRSSSSGALCEHSLQIGTLINSAPYKGLNSYAQSMKSILLFPSCKRTLSHDCTATWSYIYIYVKDYVLKHFTDIFPFIQLFILSTNIYYTSSMCWAKILALTEFLRGMKETDSK